MTRRLELRDVCAGYGAGDVLHDVDIDVEPGEVVVVLGANGAGKTTLLRTAAGVLGHRGTISLDGDRLGRRDRPAALVRRGLSLVPQGRGTLSDLTVEDNLLVGATSRRDPAGVRADLRRWYDAFPRLEERRRQLAGSLSGGEQQMLAISRAMMARPSLLLCDEASLGLAPIVTRAIFDRLRLENQEHGLSVLLVEQNAALALQLADRVYVLETGTIAASGPAADFVDNDAVRRAYLGV